jgi:2-dehydropantoate 2-reductase
MVELAVMDAARILVVGCGGIGGTVSASLCYQGLNVTALTRNAEIADAINAQGFRTQGELSLGAVAGKAVTSLPKDTPPFDFILLATQPPQVEEAARSLAGHLRPDGAIIVFQNGLCELRVSPHVGDDRVIGAIIAWGASMIEPGLYDRTSAGGFVLGRITPIEGDDARLRELSMILEAIGPVTMSQNMLGARWSKLAINCGISAIGTVGGGRLGPLLRKRYVRRMFLELITETVAVAHAEGVKLEKVAGTFDLDWIALTESERATKLGSAGLLAKHALLLAVGTRYRRLRSSMLNAIERGREPAIDFLNGEVVQRGERHGIATPVNIAIRKLVKQIAAGEKQSGQETLRRLFDDTRPPR